MRIPEYGDASANERGLDTLGQGPQGEGQAQAILGQGFEKLGQGVGSMVNSMSRTQSNIDAEAAKARQQAATIEATAAETRLEQAANRALYGTMAEGDEPTGSPQVAGNEAFEGTDKLLKQGLLNAEGLEAAKASGPTAQWIAQKRGDIAEELTTPEAKAMFMANTQKRVDAYHVDIEKHAAKSFQVAQTQTLTARMAIGLDNIAKNYADPAQVATQLEAVENNIRAMHKNDPPEVAQSIVDEYRKKADTTRLNLYVADKDWRGAQELYAQVKDQLGTDRPQMEHTIRTLRDQQEGQELGQKIVGESVQPGGLTDIDKAIRDYQATPLAKRTPEAQQAFDKNLQLAQEQNRAKASNAFSGAFSDYLQNHNLSDVNAQTKSWLQSNDPEGWHRLEEIDRQHRREMAIKGKKPEPTAAQNAVFFHANVDMSDSPQTYQKASAEDLLRTLGDKVTPEQMQKLQARLSQIHGAKVPNEALPSWANNLIISEGRNAKVFPDKGNPATDPAAGATHAVIEADVMQKRAEYRSANKGAEPSPEKVREWIAPQFAKHTILDTGILFNDTKTAAEYQANPKYRGKRLDMDEDVPSEDRERLATAMRRAGAAVTPDAIKERYQQEKQKFQNKVAPTVLDSSVGPTQPTKAKMFDHPGMAWLRDI